MSEDKDPPSGIQIPPVIVPSEKMLRLLKDSPAMLLLEDTCPAAFVRDNIAHVRQLSILMVPTEWGNGH